MSRISCLAAGLSVFVALPALAIDTPFDQLVDESIGYVGIADGILLIEDDISSNVCRVEISEAFWAGYSVGAEDTVAANRPNIICVPSTKLSDDSDGRTPDKVPFDRIVDESIAYVNVGEGLVLIEDEISSKMCRVQIPDAYFAAYAAGDDDAMRANPPQISCINSPELNN